MKHEHACSTHYQTAQKKLARCVEVPPTTTVNRYCRAGMCVPSDPKHEPWCTAHRQPPNAMYTAKPANYSGDTDK